MAIPKFEAFTVPSSKDHEINESFWRQGPSAVNDGSAPPADGHFYARAARNPATGKIQRAHMATDVHAVMGSDVVPGWRGRVKAVNVWGPAYGNSILLEHGYRHRHGKHLPHSHLWYSYYAHNSEILVAVGEFVDPHGKNSVIAHSGDSGVPGSPHSHQEIQNLSFEWDCGLPDKIDPWPGLEKIRKS